VAAFWAATPVEFWDAYDALMERSGPRTAALSRDEYEQLKARHPDGVKGSGE